jgi:hypothetical protein
MRSEGKHLLVAVASLEPLAKRQTLLKLLDGKSVVIGDPRADKGLTLLVDRDGMEIDVRQSDSSRCRPSGHACRGQQ